MTLISEIKAVELPSLEILKGYIGRPVHISGGSEYFGLHFEGNLLYENGAYYIERKGSGGERIRFENEVTSIEKNPEVEHKMDITDYVKRCESLSVTPLSQTPIDCMESGELTKDDKTEGLQSALAVLRNPASSQA